MLVDERAIVVSVVLLITLPMLTHSRHVQESPDIVESPIPVQAVEELPLPKDHLDMIKPQLAKATLFLVFLLFAANPFEEFRVLKSLQEKHLSALIVTSPRLGFGLLPSEVLLNSQRDESDSHGSNRNDFCDFQGEYLLLVMFLVGLF